MTNEELILKARQLGEALQETDDFAAYLLAKTAADRNEELQDLLGQFNLRKLDLNRAVTAETKDPARINELNQEVKHLYEKLVSHPMMIAYSTTKEELDQTVNFLLKIISASAAGDSPYEVEDDASCAGDCSSCGGCH